MEGFLIRGGDPILPESGGVSTLARGATPAALWLHEPQAVTTQFGWGFRTLQRGIETGDLRFHPRVIGVVGIWEDFLSRDWNSEFLGAAGP